MKENGTVHVPKINGHKVGGSAGLKLKGDAYQKGKTTPGKRMAGKS